MEGVRKGSPESANTLPKNKQKAGSGTAEKKNVAVETSLIVSIDIILEAVDKRKLTAVIYVDLSKVFNSINHSILLQKLKAIGPAPSVVSWFNSYLSHRSQVVRINAALSDALPAWCVECHKTSKAIISKFFF